MDSYQTGGQAVKAVAVETVRVPAHPEYLWVLVETDEGLVGTGETMPRVGPVERVIHDVLAPMLVGTDPAPEPFWQRAFQALAYHGYAGAELRALSAVDIALWDLLGQAAGLPVHRLLGGPCRPRVPVYNTCVSHGAIRDHERFRTDAGELARELRDEGYTAMKIWPFDDASIPSGGQRITAAQLRAACEPFAAIRAAVGDDMDVALEGHSCWNLPSAIRIAQALEEFRPMWLEDLLPAGEPGAWAELRAATSTPICGSERLFTRYGVTPFLDARAFDIVKQDLCWTGGFTEFAKVAALAAARELPVAPHNCHGPVGAMATLHAAAAVPNLYLMESIRSFTRGFHADLVDDPPVIEGGYAVVPERPGLGVRLGDDVVAGAVRERTEQGAPEGGWTSGDPWAGKLGDRV
jgi:L-alanine-DL-glutamate epimerase-like enolase superfamily enzyme